MSGQGNKFSETIARIVEDNEEFFKNEVKDVLDEVVEFVNDAIDYAGLLSRLPEAQTSLVQRAIYFFTYHVLMPGSYSIFVNLLAGGLPACFRELRFILESLAKCYLADLRYPQETFFARRLESLHKEKRADGRGTKREYEFLREFAGMVERGGKASELWSSLSKEGHAHGYMERVVGNIVDRDNVPAYALVIPMNYNVGDRADLNELYEYTREVRGLVTEAMERLGFRIPPVGSNLADPGKSPQS